MRKKEEIMSLIISVAAGMLLYFMIYVVYHPFIVAGVSMEPTFYSEDLVICHPFYSMSRLKAGDIVIYRYGHKNLIKRVVALPGDTVKIIDGYLYVNGELSEYNYEQIDDPGVLKDAFTLASGEIIYLGDNRNNSIDSRENGVGRIENIIGVVDKKLIKHNGG